MKTRFFSPSRISAGYRSVLVVATAAFISAASPALAQDDIYFPAKATPRASQPSRTSTIPRAPKASRAPEISQEALDGLLAPIALYPDALLAQVLMATTYPMDVIEAARWQQEHPDLDEQALQEELDSFDWDPSVKSLVAVPQVLQYMNDSPRWMWDLGNAVMDDQQRVMESVQMLRQKAHANGSLMTNDKQTVSVDTAYRDEYITITPASPRVVYVPVYDPYVVYGPWWWPSRPYYWGPPYGMAFSAGYYWGSYYYPSMAFWGGFNWGIGVMTINRPIYVRHYRRAPSSIGPNNAWRRPPNHHRPSYGRGSSMRSSPSYSSPGRVQRSSATSPRASSDRGGFRGGSRHGGGRSGRR